MTMNPDSQHHHTDPATHDPGLTDRDGVPPPPAGGQGDTRLINPTTTANAQGMLGPYTITGKVGKGGMGEVLLGWDAALKRQVALKIIPPDMASHPLFIERFNREAQAVAALNHPNIIAIYYFGEDRGRLFFAMEYVDGVSVDRKVEELGRLDLVEAVRITIQAAEALRYAASRGVVHRDIKPSNLLIDREGTVKLADFGLAKMTAGGGDGSLTTTGAIIGSPWFMSPEQAQGLPVDFRSDMYSLGCTLYFLASGEPPFRGESTVSVLVKHVQEPVPETPILSGALNGRLMQVIRRMTAKTPEERHPTYDEMLADLRGLEKHLAAEAGIGGIPSSFTSVGLSAPPRPRQKSASNFPKLALFGALALVVGGVLLGGVLIAINAMSGGSELAAPSSRPAARPSETLSEAIPPAMASGPDLTGPAAAQPVAAPINNKVPTYDEVQACLQYFQGRYPEASHHLENYNFIGTAQSINQSANVASLPQNERLLHTRLLRILGALGPLRRDLPRMVAANLPMTVQSDNGPVTITAANEMQLAAQGANGAQYAFAWNTHELPSHIFLQMANKIYGPAHDEQNDIRLILFAMLFQLGEYKTLMADFQKQHGKPFEQCDLPQLMMGPGSAPRMGEGAGAAPGMTGGQPSGPSGPGGATRPGANRPARNRPGSPNNAPSQPAR